MRRPVKARLLRTFLALVQIGAAISLAFGGTPSIAQSTGLSVSGTLPAATRDASYLQALQMTGGVSPVVFTETGNLPEGMSWVASTSGVLLNGVPKVEGSYPLSVSAKDATGQSFSWSGTLIVAGSSGPKANSGTPTVYMMEDALGSDITVITIGLSVSPSTVPQGTAGVAYPTVTFTSPGGGDAVDFSESGSLPQGMTASPGNNNLVLSGTPTQSGTFVFTVYVADHAGHSGGQRYILDVAQPPPLVLTPSTVPGSFNVGDIYPTTNIQSTGGTGPGTLALTSGSLPPGISFFLVGGSTDGILGGTPTKPGTYNFTITATDPNIPTSTASQTYTINVSMPHYDITPGSFPYAVSGTPYSQGFSIVGSPSGCTLTLTNTAALPPGLTYSASGDNVLVGGNPPVVSAFTSYGPFSFNLTDMYGNVETLGPVGIGVEPAPVATIAITTSPSAPIYTDQITLNYAASGNYPSVPTGRIIATLDGAASSLYLTLANGAASVKIGTLAPGTHTLVYSYSGDSVYPGTGSTMAGAPAVNTQTFTFTVAFPPYYLTGASTSVMSNAGYYDAVDPLDNVYLADTNNNVIRRYDTSGNLTVVPSTGLKQPRGMVSDGSGNLYIADSQNNRIVKLAANGTQTAVSTGTITLNYPSALAFDSSYQNLWIVDQNNARVLDYDIGSQTVVTANTLTGFGNAPISAAVARDGTVYVGTQSAYANGGLYKFNPGTTTTTELSYPQLGGGYSLAFDRFGNLYVSDYYNLYRMDASGNLTQIGTQLQANIALDSQATIWLANGSLGEFVQGPAGYAGITPSSEGTHNGGLSSTFGHTFRTYFHSPAGTTLTAIAVPTNNAYSLPGLTASDGFAYADLARGPNNPGLQRGSLTATFSDSTTLAVSLYGSAYNTELGVSPGVVSQTATNTINGSTSFGGMTVDQNSNVYFVDTVAKQVYSTTGGTINSVGFDNLSAPTQVAVDGAGAVYVLDSGTGRIVKHAANRLETVVFDLSAQSALSSLTAFALDGATNLYLAGANNDGQGNGSDNGRIQKLSALGTYSNFSVGLVAVPTALAFDRNSLLYSGDASGLVTQFNHYGAPGAFASGLGTITAMTIEPSGTVYATTSGSATLSVVSPQGVVSSHRIAGVTNPLAVAEDNAGTLTVADGASGQIFTEVRDPLLLYPYGGSPSIATFNFPGTVVGSSSPVQNYTFSNIGTTLDEDGYSGLTIESIPNRQDFPQASSTTCVAGTTSLAAGATCVLAYTFTPASAGNDSEGDYISYSTPHYNSTYSQLSPTFAGTAISQYPNISFSTTSLEFGNVGVGRNATQTIIVSNLGAATLHLNSISINQAVYSYTTNCGTTVAAFTTCNINVVFTPSSLGQQGAVMFVADDTGGNSHNTQELYLDGTGITVAGSYVFVVNGAGSVTSFSTTSGSNPDTAAGGGIGAAIDASGNLWSIKAGGTSVFEFNSLGALANTYSGAGIASATALAIDGNGYVFIANSGSISALTNAGAAVSTTPVAQAGNISTPNSISVDTAGSLWLANTGNNTVTEVIGAAAPVTAPTVTQVINSTPGSKP